GRLRRHGSAQFTYDEAGRLIERREGERTWIFTWSGDGHLARVRRPDRSQVSHAYDALGRRLRTHLEDASGAPVQPTRHVWDGEVLLHLVEEGRDDHGPWRREQTFIIGAESHAPWASREIVHRDGRVETGAWSHYVNDPVGAPDQLITSDGR